MTFELYYDLYHKSRSIKQVDPFLENRIDKLDSENSVIFYMLILHYKNTHRENFDVKSKFPYGIEGTEKIIYGSISRFPVELQKIIQAFLDEIS